jgi:hypothetical protein
VAGPYCPAPWAPDHSQKKNHCYIILAVENSSIVTKEKEKTKKEDHCSTSNETKNRHRLASFKVCDLHASSKVLNIKYRPLFVID